MEIYVTSERLQFICVKLQSKEKLYQYKLGTKKGGSKFNFPTVLDVSYHFIIALSCVKDTKLINNKNAFQWDAYRPLIDRIPACTVAGGGGTCLGGTCPGGVPAMGGTCPGTPLVDRQTRVKT